MELELINSFQSGPNSLIFTVHPCSFSVALGAMFAYQLGPEIVIVDDISVGNRLRYLAFKSYILVYIRDMVFYSSLDRNYS